MKMDYMAWVYWAIGATKAQEIKWTPVSSEELNLDIEIDEHVEVNNLDEGIKYGTVFQFAKFGDMPIVGLQMDNPSTVYNTKMEHELRELVMKLYPTGGKYYFVSPSQVQRTPEIKWTLISSKEIDSDIQIGEHVEVSNLEENVKYGTVFQIAKFGDMPIVGLKMDIPSNVYSTEMDPNLRRLAMKYYPTDGTYFLVNPSQVEKIPENGKCNDITLSATNSVTDRGTQAKAGGTTGSEMAALKAGITDVQNKIVFFDIRLKKLNDNLNKTIGKIAAESNKREIDIKRLQAQMTVLETTYRAQIHALEKKHESLIYAQETKHHAQMRALGMIIFIIILIVACYIRSISADNIAINGEVEIGDIKHQSTVTTDEVNKMSVKQQLSTFDTTMSNIQANYPNEGSRFWSSLFAPVRRIIQEKNPSRPAVVLIATTRSYSSIAERLSQEVASLVETLYDLNDNSDTYITLEAAHMTSLDPDEAKLQMDHALSDNYQRRHMVAVIHDIGFLPATAATLLHAYCDHESAHFKNVVLLATLYLEPGVTLCNEEVEAYLSDVWQELEEDVLKPLVSRVANNIAIMEPRDITNIVCET